MGAPVTVTGALVDTVNTTVSPACTVPGTDPVSVTAVMTGWVSPRNTAVVPSVACPPSSVRIRARFATPTVPAAAAAVSAWRNSVACAAVPVNERVPPAPVRAPSRLSANASRPAVSTIDTVSEAAGTSEKTCAPA